MRDLTVFCRLLLPLPLLIAGSLPAEAQGSNNTVWRSTLWRVWTDEDSCNLSQTGLRERLADGRSNMTVELLYEEGASLVMIYGNLYPDFSASEHRVALVFGNGEGFTLSTGERRAISANVEPFGNGIALFLDPEKLLEALSRYDEAGVLLDGKVVDRMSLRGSAEGVSALKNCAGH